MTSYLFYCMARLFSKEAYITRKNLFPHYILDHFQKGQNIFDTVAIPQSVSIPSNLLSPRFLKKKLGYCDTARPSVGPAVRTSVCNVTPLFLDHLS